MFYDKLKSEGYNGVMDINDQKYSGYKSKAPVILFNKADKVSVSGVNKMVNQEIDSNYNKVRYKALAKEGAAYGGAYAVVKKSIDSANVNKYRSDNPNTDLTNKEILKLSKQKNEILEVE